MFVTFSRKSWNLNDVRNPKEPRWNAITGGQLNCGGKKYNFKYGLAYLQSVYMWSEVWNDQLGMHPSPSLIANARINYDYSNFEETIWVIEIINCLSLNRQNFDYDYEFRLLWVAKGND